MEAETANQPVDNRMQTGLDQESLAVLQKWTEHLANAKDRNSMILMLKSVINLACKNPERGLVANEMDAHGFGFDNKEVALDQGWQPDDAAQMRKINQQWQVLIDSEWDRYSQGLKQRLDEIGSGFEFWPDQHKSKGRKPNLFFIRYGTKQEGDVVSMQVTKPPLPNMAIRYYLDEVNRPKGSLSWLLKKGMKRRGKVHITILAITLLVLLAGTLVGIAAFVTNGTVYELFVMLFMWWIIMRAYDWFDRYSQGPMIPVPSIIQGGLYDDLMLEWIKEPSEISPCNGMVDMKLVLSRYSGICPLCGQIVRVCDGGKEFSRRIVGKCEGVPTEHIFSFDPITYIGYPLREWITQNDSRIHSCTKKM